MNYMPPRIEPSRSEDPVPSELMDADAFLAWTATLAHEYEGYKIELANGRVTKTMVNATRGHFEVGSNLLRLLLTTLDPDRYAVSGGEFGIKIRRSVRYPDVLVEPRNKDKKARATENPVFVAEVLSPSTTSVDFLEKLPEYTAIPSLQAYLICAQDEPIVWLIARAEDGTFPKLPVLIAGMDKTVPVTGLDLNLPMAEIYRGVIATEEESDADR